jgi:hypothetical protein
MVSAMLMFSSFWIHEVVFWILSGLLYGSKRAYWSFLDPKSTILDATVYTLAP